MKLRNNMWVRLAALPVATAAIAVSANGCGVVGAAACPEFTASADWGASLSIDAEVKTFMHAAGELSVVGTEMVADVSDACVKIATAAGGDPTRWEGKAGTELVDAACKEASASLEAALTGVEVIVGIEGGGCQVSVQATTDCYAKCDVSGQCTPGELEAQCEPGKLAGKCSGECSGSCDVDGGSVDCVGSCSATCQGTCSGRCIGQCNGSASEDVCDGMCVGQCDAECNGSCSGRCDYTAPSATCEGTCHGECTVDFEAPTCEGKFTPPACDLDAECRANCEAEVQAEASCSLPEVTYTLIGGNGQDLSALVTVMEETLPVLIVNGIERGQAALDAATRLEDSGTAIVNGSAELSGKAFACASAASLAAIDASVNIQVSVSASVNVAGSARATSE